MYSYSKSSRGNNCRSSDRSNGRCSCNSGVNRMAVVVGVMEIVRVVVTVTVALMAGSVIVVIVSSTDSSFSSDSSNSSTDYADTVLI